MTRYGPDARLLETHTSPDGLFVLEMVDLAGDLSLFLELTELHRERDPSARADWHTHAECLEGARGRDDRAVVAAYVRDIQAGVRVLACTQYRGGLRSYDFTDDPADEVEVGACVPEVEKTTFRTWAGEPVDP